ncbi:hypothetical protein JKP88DRAFT_269202 [Tribonema minus]|uniref:Serine--tRNA ligase n=1 Tax=Tribonema minus TaxID=303371 RepID=A0A835YK02_9STRA|nr:hypothetical protein JKP88DRAFT_269202 [Tribonema minus]
MRALQQVPLLSAVAVAAALRTAGAWGMRPSGMLAARGLGANLLARQQWRIGRAIATSASRRRDPRANLLRASAATEVHGRLSADGVSLDAQVVAKQPDIVLSNLRARRAGDEAIETVSSIGGLMEQRTGLIRKRDAALNTRKTLSAQIGKLMKEGKEGDVAAIKEQVAMANAEAGAADAELAEVDERVNDMFMRLPNLLDARVVDGSDEKDNELVLEWGQEYIKEGDEYLWHDDIATRLGGWDPEGASRVAGARFSVLKGQLARLERALGQWFLDVHTQEHGYQEVNVPLLVTRSVLEGTGQLPKFEDDLFQTNHKVGGEDSFLIPTAEVPLTNLVRGQMLDESDLPLAFAALTPCFRAEAGSYGRDTRGLLRQHQFLKVELVRVTSAASSADEHEALTGHAEKILQLLKLPYRKMRLCSGDIGFSARMCYDLEVWLPGQKAFREISSCSNCGDFQARRMGLRYKGKDPYAEEGKGGKGKGKQTTLACHTINGSGVAVGRALVAVLENYFNPKDGTVTVPEVLRPYMGGLLKLTPP